ncbi:MAG: regulatory protein, partial [Thermoleophilaceae bacterium]|nr:regulatory protein [Thermoleophilaceae bacterium]
LSLACRYLGNCGRSIGQVRRYLERKDATQAAIDAVVAELQAHGYLDDARFARDYVEARRRLDSWGTERLERRLRTIAVAEEHIATALATRSVDEELDAAVALLRRRLRTRLEDDGARQRALGLLRRRGYPEELAAEAVRAFERDG